MKESIKTYLVGIYTWVLLLIPNSCLEWTQFFQLLAAILGLILIAWRVRKDIFNRGFKRRRDDKKK
jgi:hypothetical protein